MILQTIGVVRKQMKVKLAFYNIVMCKLDHLSFPLFLLYLLKHTHANVLYLRIYKITNISFNY